MMNSSIAIACIHKTKIPSYLTVTSNGLFLFKSFDDRGVQKSVFLDYSTANQLAESDDYEKMINRKY